MNMLNICKFALLMLTRREIVFKNATPESMKTKLDQDSRAVVIGTRQGSKYRADATFCLVIVKNTGSLTGTELVSLFKKVNVEIKNSKPTVPRLELCLITSDKLSKTTEKKMPTSWDGFSAVISEHHEYKYFKSDITKGVYVPEHRLMSEAEVEEICAEGLFTKENCPTLKMNDGQVVMHGARPGDVMAITRPSETAGFCTIYKMVIAEYMDT